MFLMGIGQCFADPKLSSDYPFAVRIGSDPLYFYGLRVPNLRIGLSADIRFYPFLSVELF